MSNLKIGRMTLGIYGTNCYFLYRGEGGDCIVIDPADQGKRVYDALKEKGFTVKAILLTHAHFDHILGLNEMKEAAGCKVYALEEERELCENTDLNMSASLGRASVAKVDEYVKDGDELNLCGIPVKVMATPGHTAGSACFYFEEAGFLVCGDTLFFESVGRTDFPTGSQSQLVRSIREKIFTLPDDVKCYPGHGDSTTVGHEKEYNPYC